MNFWWVNQNQTYKAEVQGGFLWSPKTNKNGAKNQFYDNMTLVRPGDVVFSFCDTRIRAIGKALAGAETATKPDFGGAGGYWDNEGWYVPVEFTELRSSIRPKDMIDEIRPLLPEKYSPLQKNGDGLQSVYLAAVPPALAQVLLDALGAEAVSIATDEFEADIDEEETVQSNIEGRTDIGPTVKRQLVNSRRGQGIFKSNVRLNERCCRLTGEADPRLLVASHIKPWKDSSDQEKLDGCNGLLLSPHVDSLFDKGLISFQDDGSVLVSSKLDSKTLERWGLKHVTNVGAFSTSQAVYLAYHREHVFKKPMVAG
jgi:putative restriction endonuclease